MKRQPQPVPPLAERERPGLSQTLTGPRDPRLCQSCGSAHHPGNALQRWLEHDAWDKLPTKPVVVVLCEQCGRQLIDAHARLYKPVQSGAPFPGAMSVCAQCRFRDGVSCSSPASSMNGGPGLKLRWRKLPDRMHLNFGGGRGSMTHLFHGPVIACSGREERAT